MLTLEQVREHSRMAHHDPVGGIEFWWGPNAGLRMYMPDGWPFEAETRWKARDIVAHIWPEVNTLYIPRVVGDAIEASNFTGMADVRFHREVVNIPQDGWHHMAGCDCEFCTTALFSSEVPLHSGG